MNSTRSLFQDWPQSGTSIAELPGHEWRQYLELLRIGIRQGLRPAINESGKRSSPLRSFSITMLAFGFLFLANARFYADLATYFTLIFTSALSIQLMGVFPVRTALEMAVEILHSKPISDRVHMAASISQRIFFAWIICTFFAAIPLIASRWYFRASWSTIAGTYLLLILLSVSSLIIAVSVILQLSASSSYSKIQTATKYLLMSTTLIFVAPSLAACFARDVLTTPRFSIWSISVVQWFPPVWFATFLVPDGHPVVNPQRSGVILLVSLAVLLCFRKRSYSHYSGLLERMNSAGSAPLRLPVVLRIASVLARIRSKRRPVSRGFALASVMLLQSAREENFRLRRVTLLAIQSIVFVLFTLHPGTYMLLLVTWYGLFNIVDGIHMVSASSFSNVSWLFGVAPASSKQIKRGMEGAVFLGGSLLPGLLVLISLYLAYRPILATALAVIYLLYARILISVSLVVQPRFPLSGDVNSKHQLGGLLYSMLANLGLSSIFLIIVAITGFSSLLGLAASAVAVASLAVASWLMSVWACRRMLGIESYH